MTEWVYRGIIFFNLSDFVSTDFHNLAFINILRPSSVYEKYEDDKYDLE